MFNLETSTETVVKRVVVLTLNEEDIAKILVDARGLQKQLRTLKGQWRKSEAPSSWSASGAPKATEKKSGKGIPRQAKGVNHTPKIKCEICGRLIGAQGMHKHLAKHAANAD